MSCSFRVCNFLGKNVSWPSALVSKGTYLLLLREVKREREREREKRLTCRALSVAAAKVDCRPRRRHRDASGYYVVSRPRYHRRPPRNSRCKNWAWYLKQMGTEHPSINCFITVKNKKEKKNEYEKSFSRLKLNYSELRVLKRFLTYNKNLIFWFIWFFVKINAKKTKHFVLLQRFETIFQVY